MGGEIVRLHEVGSTNDWLAERAAAGAPDGLWVRADRQTAGRGRRGRAWEGLGGNLFASTLVRAQPGEGPPRELSFVASLAVADALSGWVAVDRLALKWPNDVLLDALKLAGILLEGAAGGTIVGIGVNLAAAPVGLERPAISLASVGIVPPPPAVFLDELVRAFEQWRGRWRTEGFRSIRGAWLARAADRPGSRLVARLGEETLVGVFEGLQDDGALRLRLVSGDLRSIYAGELFSL